MVCIHNGFIRGLNSIILQAPHVKTHDYASFIQYAQVWSETLKIHHDAEEQVLFPAIEEAANQPGLLAENLEGHKLFHDGLQELDKYLQSVAAEPSDFSSARLLSLIDGFAPALHDHLASEIPTILNLRNIKPPVPYIKIEQNAVHQTSKLKFKPGMRNFVVFLFNHDLTYEPGLWDGFPPVPAALKYFMVYGFSWWNNGVWKFGCCDRSGKPRELYALGEE